MSKDTKWAIALVLIALVVLVFGISQTNDVDLPPQDDTETSPAVLDREEEVISDDVLEAEEPPATDGTPAVEGLDNELGNLGNALVPEVATTEEYEETLSPEELSQMYPGIPPEMIRQLREPDPPLPPDFKAQLASPPPVLPAERAQQLRAGAQPLSADFEAQLGAGAVSLPPEFVDMLREAPVITADDLETETFKATDELTGPIAPFEPSAGTTPGSRDR